MAGTYARSFVTGVKVLGYFIVIKRYDRNAKVAIERLDKKNAQELIVQQLNAGSLTVYVASGVTCLAILYCREQAPGETLLSAISRIASQNAKQFNMVSERFGFPIFVLSATTTSILYSTRLEMHAKRCLVINRNFIDLHADMMIRFTQNIFGTICIILWFQSFHFVNDDYYANNLCDACLSASIVFVYMKQIFTMMSPCNAICGLMEVSSDTGRVSRKLLFAAVVSSTGLVRFQSALRFV
jgi:hypothetical protein